MDPLELTRLNEQRLFQLHEQQRVAEQKVRAFECIPFLD
jgi:hypothetical protein